MNDQMALMQRYLENESQKARRRRLKTHYGKKPRDLLRAMINKELRHRHLLDDHDEFDAVAMMAVIAQRAFNSGDTMMALAAAKEVAKYTWAPVQSTPPEPAEVEEEKVQISDATRRFQENMLNRYEVIPPDEVHDDAPRREGPVIDGEAHEVDLTTSNTRTPAPDEVQ